MKYFVFSEWFILPLVELQSNEVKAHTANARLTPSDPCLVTNTPKAKKSKSDSTWQTPPHVAQNAAVKGLGRRWGILPPPISAPSRHPIPSTESLAHGVSGFDRSLLHDQFEIMVFSSQPSSQLHRRVTFDDNNDACFRSHCQAEALDETHGGWNNSPTSSSGSEEMAGSSLFESRLKLRWQIQERMKPMLVRRLGSWVWSLNEAAASFRCWFSNSRQSAVLTRVVLDCRNDCQCGGCMWLAMSERLSAGG